MSFFKNFRRMLKKPVPRWLFGYSWGSTILFFAIYFLAPISWIQKQVIASLLLLPFMVVCLLEFCLLVRERKVWWFVRSSWKLLLILLVFGSTHLFFAPPDYRWKFFAMWPLLWIFISLWALWCARMTKRGAF